MSTSTEATAVRSPEPFVGRGPVVEAIALALLEEAPMPLPVLGALGAGKTTAARAALAAPGVLARYGARRFYADLSGAETAESALAAIGLAIGASLGLGLRDRVLQELARTPAALVLDEADVPWSAETQATEALFAELSSVLGLAMVVALNGDQRPFGVRWADTVTVPPIRLPEARELFLGIAGQGHATLSNLEDLLRALDGLPLAVELVARMAAVDADPARVWRRWREARQALVSNVRGDDRPSGAAVSSEVAIWAAGMTHDARRLLSLLALLPSGIASADLDGVQPGTGALAAATLAKCGLAHEEGGRLRTGHGLRVFMRRFHPPMLEDLEAAILHYVKVAESQGAKIGASDGAEAMRALAAELPNIEAMIRAGLGASDPRPAISGATALTRFFRFSGIGAEPLLEHARAAARRAGSALDEATCAKSLGDVALFRAETEAARARYEEALAIYQRVGATVGEANCVKRLGDIAREAGDFGQAKERYEAAAALFRKAGSVLGAANCVKALGDVAVRLLEDEAAETRYREALELFRQVSDILGQANALRRMGEIAIRKDDLASARKELGEARPLFERAGDAAGAAACAEALADLERRETPTT